MLFLRQFLRFLKVRKKYSLVPVLIDMLMLGGLLVLSQGSVMAPFIYTLF
jgi:hypothetical protein